MTTQITFSPEPMMSEVVATLMKHPRISTRRLQEQVSALKTAEEWSGKRLQHIQASVSALRDLFEPLESKALGVSRKRLANVKSLCLSALAKSEALSGSLAKRAQRRPKPPEWAELWNKLRLPVQQNSLSRLVNWCSRAGIAPHEVNSRVMDRVMADMANTSLRPNQYQVRRTMTKTWNEIGDIFPEKNLQKVAVPPSRLRRTRIPIASLPQGFMDDWHDFACWANGNDVFADKRRPHPLKQSTLDIMFCRVHLAASLLVATGVDVASIWSLSDLVGIDTFKKILRQLHAKTKGQPNYDAFFTATSLIQIAREWVKVAPDHLEKMKGLIKVLPRPEFEMSRKNKLLVMKFNDPVLYERYLTAPDKIWHEIQSGCKRGRLRLAEAQAALALSVLMYMPIRLGNLTSLAFDEHMFLRQDGTSTLLITAAETKTKEDVEFDIPPEVATRLIEYRDVIAPAVIGRRPKYLFSNVDGSVKGFAGVRYLVQRYLKLYVGIHMNPHAFRHLAAKLILDQNPGGHVVVQHLLGHKSLATTATFYAGRDTPRAGRHHHALLTKALDERRANQARSKVARPSRRASAQA
ncbi:tyrosine-type recombinase/integrase [Mesorhizobium sp. AR10]|uniref:site-specific integrase n=1 Tax=Mesorhizobium sp. AR10 TaxID=2865839 RepID=UPI00215FD46D|nr:site-specific integrase [Mesorhizobium sp. AR10]UVK38851.1 tyrosine-type recombinase/integrase [Mesorhizobium sp. AR10]